jgi:hypothetical protein
MTRHYGMLIGGLWLGVAILVIATVMGCYAGMPAAAQAISPQPARLESLVSEWMHDWDNPKAGELVKEVYSRYGAMIGLR